MHDYAELLRVNAEHKRMTGISLIDIDLIKALTREKAEPDKHDRKLPGLRPGVVEVIADIFGSGKITEVMNDGSTRPWQSIGDDAPEEADDGADGKALA